MLYTYKPKIEDILTPTKIYYELMELYKTYENNILGVAHITGGGFMTILYVFYQNIYIFSYMIGNSLTYLTGLNMKVN